MVLFLCRLNGPFQNCRMCGMLWAHVVTAVYLFTLVLVFYKHAQTIQVKTQKEVLPFSLDFYRKNPGAGGTGALNLAAMRFFDQLIKPSFPGVCSMPATHQKFCTRMQNATCCPRRSSCGARAPLNMHLFAEIYCLELLQGLILECF